MKSACIRAGVKLGFGLSVVVALVGIRIVTATPDGVEAGLEKLAQLDEEIAAEAQAQQLEKIAPAGPDIDVNAGEGDRSVVDQLNDAVRGRTSDERAAAREDDKLVSCRLGGGTQFMRAHDCAMRGGRSEVVSLER